jgi:hypothetical protein
MENKEYTVGEFTFSVANEHTITIKRDGKQFIAFRAEDVNQTINDIVAGLMAINPGPNLHLLSRGDLAKHFDRSNSSISYWEENGYIPGLVRMADVYTQDGQQVHGGYRTAMPKALLPYVHVPSRGSHPGGPRARKVKPQES